MDLKSKNTAFKTHILKAFCFKYSQKRDRMSSSYMLIINWKEHNTTSSNSV